MYLTKRYKTANLKYDYKIDKTGVIIWTASQNNTI